MNEIKTIRDIEKSSRAEGSLFSNSAISKHLTKLGHPETSIKSMLRCGEKTGYKTLRICGKCGLDLICLSYHCNLRTCKDCALRRKKRIKDKYLPYLRSIPVDRNKYQFYFITISPANYGNCKEGLDKVRTYFKKFVRSKYISDRIKGGLYVTESKTKNKFGNYEGWNTHIHAIFYGKRLDNRIRGKCLDCSQSLIKFNKNLNEYSCANSKCRSLNVEKKKDSRLVRLFKKISGIDVNIHIAQKGTHKSSLDYMLKYVSANKDDFYSVEDLAEYIFTTRKQRLINSFGLFFNIKVKHPGYTCYICGSPVKFIFDIEIMNMVEEEKLKLKLRPPDLRDYFYK